MQPRHLCIADTQMEFHQMPLLFLRREQSRFMSREAKAARNKEPVLTVSNSDYNHSMLL
jgi:hypothetical protein